MGEATLKRVLQLCDERHLSINKLSEICGITQSTLSNWINRGIESPTLTTIKKICDGLEIDLIYFFNCDLFRDLEQEIK